MKLKGSWSADASYNVGDIVMFEGGVYILQRPQISGVVPKSTLCWNQLNQPLNECVMLIMDALGIAKEETLDEIEKYFLNDQTLLLKAGEGDDEKTYAVTVDTTGDTPDLAVAAVTEGE